MPNNEMRMTIVTRIINDKLEQIRDKPQLSMLIERWDLERMLYMLIGSDEFLEANKGNYPEWEERDG